MYTFRQIYDEYEQAFHQQLLEKLYDLVRDTAGSSKTQSA